MELSVSRFGRGATKVMTGIAGFVNHFKNIRSRPNAVLKWCPEKGMGQHVLCLSMLDDVGEGREIVIHYGPKFQIGEPKRRRSQK